MLIAKPRGYERPDDRIGEYGGARSLKTQAGRRFGSDFAQISSLISRQRLHSSPGLPATPAEPRDHAASYPADEAVSQLVTCGIYYIGGNGQRERRQENRGLIDAEAQWLVETRPAAMNPRGLIEILVTGRIEERELVGC